MESAAHAYREAISGLVEERICPIFGQVMDFLGLRDADEKFLEPLKCDGSSLRNNNLVDNRNQHSVAFNGGPVGPSGPLGPNWNPLTPQKRFQSAPFGPLANGNGTAHNAPPGECHSVTQTSDRKTAAAAAASEADLPSSTPIHYQSKSGSDLSLGNGCHGNKSCSGLKSPRNDENCVSNGRPLLDFSLFSFNNSENRNAAKGYRSEYGTPQHTAAQPAESSSSFDPANSSSAAATAQQLMQYAPERPVTSDDPETTGPGEEKLGRLQFSISYDFQESTLTLRIIRAVDLVAKDFSGTSDPYVKIMLLPDKKRKLTTNVKRKNLNPRWNEVFAFEGFPYHKLLTRTLYLQVLDYDRFSRDDPIGEICIPMSDIDLVRGQTLWKNLQISKGHTGRLGEVNIGLCYQPTTGQLTVAVHEARQLKAKDLNGLSDPYVKIWLLSDGKKTEKKKTLTKEKTLNPVFEESFVFTVPYERIRQASVSVSVMDYDRMGRNEQIGQIVLGTKSGAMEMKHWNEMFAKTRQEVTQWHILKDLG